MEEPGLLKTTHATVYLVLLDLEKEIVKMINIYIFFIKKYCNSHFDFTLSDLQVPLTSVCSMCPDIKSNFSMLDTLAGGIIMGSSDPAILDYRCCIKNIASHL